MRKKEVRKVKKSKEEIEEQTEGDPVCKKCGNVMAQESLDSTRDESLEKVYPEQSQRTQDSEGGEWMCPHCDGEIDFLGGDDE